jgi:hypothetical protein
MAVGAQNSGSLSWVGMEVHWWKKIKAQIIPSTSLSLQINLGSADNNEGTQELQHFS